MTIKVSKIVKRPFFSVRRMWTDYRVGLAIRKERERAEQSDVQESNDCKEKTVCEEEVVEEHLPTTEPRLVPSAPAAPRPDAPPSSSLPREGWQRNWEAEFPWCYRQVVYEEGNWRGTWTLEVKDMQAMDWGTERVPNESGRGGKYRRRPTKQFPFGTREEGLGIVLVDGGQDDLMFWLGKA